MKNIIDEDEESLEPVAIGTDCFYKYKNVDISNQPYPFDQK